MEWLTGVLDFLKGIPADVWTLLPVFPGSPGWAGFLQKVVELLIGATALTRIVPDKWITTTVVGAFRAAGLVISVPAYALGKGISTVGRKFLGSKWEYVEEHVFEKALMVFFKALLDGVGVFVQLIRNGVFDGLDLDD